MVVESRAPLPQARAGYGDFGPSHEYFCQDVLLAEVPCQVAAVRVDRAVGVDFGKHVVAQDADGRRPGRRLGRAIEWG